MRIISTERGFVCRGLSWREFADLLSLRIMRERQIGEQSRRIGIQSIAISAYRNVIDSLIADFDNLSEEMKLQVSIAVISDSEYFQDPPEKVSRVFWEYADRLKVSGEADVVGNKNKEVFNHG